MAQDQILQSLTPDEYKTQQQSTEQDTLRALQEGTPNANKAVQQSIQPRFPNWPTSIPGPQVTPPPPGMKPVNAIRREQLAEIGYNQETGEPGTDHPLRSMPDESMKDRTSFDQQETAQEALKRRKQRL